MLFEFDADPNLKTSTGWTLLMIATLNGHYDILELHLMKAKVDLNCFTVDGTTAFYRTQNGQYNIVSLLLNSGADPTLQKNNG